MMRRVYIIAVKNISHEKPISPWPERSCQPQGLTLLELLIAFVVLQVALVIFAQFITRALDFSREVRRMEMAQILAQSKMEELIRTISVDPSSRASFGNDDSPRILNREPGSFSEIASMQAEDASSFRWLAEAQPAPENPHVLNLTLYVYVIKIRTKSGQASMPSDEFYVSDDREWFNLKRSLDDATVEVITGKERLRVSSAVALP